MMKLFYIFSLIFGQFYFAFGKISPAHEATLTQTQIMFEIEEVEMATYYIVEFYKTQPNSLPVLLKQIEIRSLAILMDSIFQFGNTYSWKYKGLKNKDLLFTSSSFSFTIGSCARVDTNKFKTIITTNSGNTQNKNLVFLDYPAMAIKKTGEPVWYLPLDETALSALVIRDLQLSLYNTITYVDAQNCYEKELNGNLIWEGPLIEQKTGNFHHSFLKLASNTYMVCGYRENQKENSGKKYNTLIQFNTTKNIIWKWDEITALQEDPIFKNNSNKSMAGHLNGFAFSKDSNKIFLSFKNLSNIFLLNKVSGKMITTLKQEKESALFLQQHGPFFTQNNELILYNNNILDNENETKRNPGILIFSFDHNNNSFKKNWEYPILSDSFPEGIKGKEGFAMETKAHSILICTGGNNYALEVNRKKQKVWEGYFYKKIIGKDGWQPYSNYRCHSSSSLYPYYFTVQSKFSANQIKINNDGTEDGVFEIILSGKPEKVIRTVKIKAGKSETVKINIAEKKQSLLIKPKGIEGISRSINL